MIKVERISVMNFDNAIRGARNPLNSWDKADSHYDEKGAFVLGPNDLSLAKRLCDAGSDHRKFIRQIFVSMDITAPLYWWKEFDTYKVGTVANSCSTMHKIHDKEFTMDDFSYEHLIGMDIDFDNFDECPMIDVNPVTNGYCGDPDGEEGQIYVSPYYWMRLTIDILNQCRQKYIETKEKKYWWQMIQLLPSSYNQKRTVMLNYEVLKNMYHARKNHKLNEWRDFCNWVEMLPYHELIVGYKTHLD